MVRYAAQFGAHRVAKVVTVGAVPPIMLRSADNPDGTPIEVFDDIRAGVLRDRSQFYRELAVSFYGFNRDRALVSQGAVDDFWRQGMLVNLAAAYDCVKAFSETDQTDDRRALSCRS